MTTPARKRKASSSCPNGGKWIRPDKRLAINLRDEFADVLAWLATLANITGVDLTQAIHDKYIKDGGPEGTKG